MMDAWNSKIVKTKADSITNIFFKQYTSDMKFHKPPTDNIFPFLTEGNFFVKSPLSHDIDIVNMI